MTNLFLIVFGCIELALRTVIAVALACSLIGMFVFLLLEDEEAIANAFFRSALWAKIPVQ